MSPFIYQKTAVNLPQEALSTGNSYVDFSSLPSPGFSDACLLNGQTVSHPDYSQVVSLMAKDHILQL